MDEVLHFSRRASKSLRFFSTEPLCILGNDYKKNQLEGHIN